jgi:valyl-tRNA synthetase
MPFQEKDLVTGQKFTTKLWNASKFAAMHLEGYHPKKPSHLSIMDKWILSKLTTIIKDSTDTFDRYEYAKTKLEVEKFFWHTFCDNYLEIVKDRMYNPDKRGHQEKESAQFGLHTSLLSILKLMAPIMPYITEEVYQSYFKEHEKSKSIHISNWPSLEMKDESAEKAGDFFVLVLEKVRKSKSERKISLKAPVEKLTIRGSVSKEEFESFKEDLMATTGAKKIEFENNKEVSIDISFEAD